MRLITLQRGLWGAVVLALMGVAALRMMDQGAAVADQDAFRPEFALADAEGQTRTNAEFAGKHLLVFFGFTNCPDVCPTTLSEVAQVMDDLGEDASRVQPIFISVDPERDRRLGITAFTQAFHPSILGLAGDDVATRAAADSFKIFYESESDPNAPDGYTMSHSPALYLVGPEGDWLRQFSYGTLASEILADLQSRL